MKEIFIRIGCVLLGVVLTLTTIRIGQFITEREMEDALVIESQEEPSVEEIVEELVINEDVKLYSEYDEEAEEKLKLLEEEHSKLAAEAEAKAQAEENEEEEKTVSANSIEAAPVKWIKDYPQINSDKLLEEKELERSSYEETMAVNAFDKKVIENSTIDFSDVKITIIGDSLTEGSNLSDEDRKKYAYPVILQEILGCKEVVNLGIGGSSVSSCGDNAMVERWDEISKDSDIIIVFGGSNDCLFQNKWDFGNLEYEHRMKDATFCGDFDKLMGKIEYRYRDNNEDNYCKLICINPPSTILNDAVYAINPVNMVHQKSFAEAINEIAPAYSFEVIDLYNNNILNSHDKAINEQFVPDGIHCNPEGYRILAEHIASQIIQRIEQ